MSSYSVTFLQKGLLGGGYIAACGSFGNFQVEGRYSLENAIRIAEDFLVKENALYKEKSQGKNRYEGFVIEKTRRFLDYKQPLIVGVDAKLKDIML